MNQHKLIEEITKILDGYMKLKQHDNTHDIRRRLNTHPQRRLKTNNCLEADLITLQPCSRRARA